ncbi:hypothetical protein Sj15T_11430 [Sphingobium sp. TA15]|nr:hypothetical protein Sj15T_11430 [Sphingobium sp. TA15]
MPSGGLVLLPAYAYANLANVGSVQTSMLRVAPGKPDKSYIMNKILGTHGSVRGKGNAMPIGQPPLLNSEIEIVRVWIAQGGKNN